MDGGAVRGALTRLRSWRPRRRVLIAVLVTIAVAIALVPALLGRMAPVPPSFEAAAVARGTVISTITATATVRPLDQVEVGSQVSGTLAEVKVDYNSTVKRGQVLALIEPSSFRARVVQQRAAVARAAAAQRKAARELERAKELFGRELSSRAELDAAEATADQAAADLQQANAALEVAGLDLEHTVITSPIDGVVISRDVETGQTVAASLQAPQLFVIARDLSRMRLETSVDEADVGAVRPGLTATFTVDAYPQRTFTGTVAQVRLEPTSSAGVVSYTTILQTENRDLALLPGMTADVTIELGRSAGALTVPNAALRFRPAFTPPAAPDGAARPAGGGAVGGGVPAAVASSTGDADAGETVITARAPRDTVWVVREGGPPSAVEVTTGLTDGDVTEVTGGDLAEGDRVITAETTTAATSAARTSGGLAGLFRPPGRPPGARAR